MTIRQRLRGMVTGILAVLFALVAASASSQPAVEMPELPLGSKPLPPRSPLFQRSKEPHVISQQAHFALARLRLASRLLSEGQIGPAEVATKEAYYFMRAAHENTLFVKSAQKSKFPDPLLDLQAETLKTPRYDVAKALGRLNGGAATPKAASVAAEIIAGAIVALENALVLLP